MSEYILPENIKSELKKIKKFETGSSKISSYSAVRSLFGIPEDEEIISYRVIPKLLAKLDKGGLIFTDKGVYTCLTSSGLSRDYTKYSFRYTDLLDCVVFYSAKEYLPILVDSNLEVHKLWTWTLLQGEGDEDIALAMELILKDMLAVEEYKQARVNSINILLEKLRNKQETGGGLSELELTALNYLLFQNKEDKEYLAIGNFVVFEHFCMKSDYESARGSVTLFEDMTQSSIFKNEMEKYIEKRLDCYNENLTNGSVDELELYCELTEKHFVKCFEYIITINFITRSYNRLESLLNKYAESEYISEIKSYLIEKIEFEYETNVELWAGDEYDSSKYFFDFILNIPEFFEKALYTIVQHYCQKGDFSSAKERLNKIKTEHPDDSLYDDVEKTIEDSISSYCDNKYKEAICFIGEEKNTEASGVLVEIAKLMPKKMEYRVSEIEVFSKLEKHNDVKLLIEKLSPYFSELTAEQKDIVDKCAIKYAESVYDDMRPLYELVLDSNHEELYSNDFEKAHHYDHLGMCFYHYAILMNKLDCVKTYILNEEDINIDGNYGFIDFAFGKNFDPDMYRAMIKHYDSEAKEARKKYDRKKTLRKVGNAILDAGAEAINSAVDNTLNTIKDTATKANADYENMMNDSSYYDYADRISEKMEAAQNAQNMAEQLQYTIPKVPKFSTRSSGDDLWDEYNQNIDEIAERKFDIYQGEVEKKRKDQCFGAKLIYVLIKDCSWLEKMYSSDHSNFELYIDTETIVYLPKGLIDIACEFYSR